MQTLKKLFGKPIKIEAHVAASNLDEFWTDTPHFMSKMVMHYSPLKGEELFKEQLNHLSSALLVNDYNPNVTVDCYDLAFRTNIKFINKGELLSGSFVSRSLTRAFFKQNHVDAEDIDIYFKSKEDAKEFAQLNMMYMSFDGPMCAYGHHNNMKFNLIYGVEYDSPAHLISKFDIRACSMAIDVSAMKAYMVRGSLSDCSVKQIFFNPVPRGVSVRRLLKYTQKGFEIDKYQRLFFVELARSDLYSPELELVTKEY